MPKNMMERWVTKIVLVSILGFLVAIPVRAAAYTEQLTISSNTQNYNAYSAALATGWDGVAPIDLTITISPGVVVGSVSTGAYAFDTGSGYPTGSSVTIVNNGYIVGAGGIGGTGGARLNFQCSGTAGGAGGSALHVGHNISLTNNGVIGGGGGGGGGGAAKCTGITKGNTSGGGGGGGAGSQSGAGGWSSYPYALGSSGTLTTGGAGGGVQYSCNTTGAGGTGGNLGSYGNSGGNSKSNTCVLNAYGSPGGAAGTGVTVDASRCIVSAGSGSIVPAQAIPTCALGTVAVSSNVSSSWTITGPATITGSGTSQSSPSQPAGTYTITWGDVPGYTAPATQSLTLISGSTITFNGTYVAATCSVSSVSWSVSGTNCGNDAYGPAEIADGASVVVPSTNGNTGDVTLTCTAGEVSQTSPTCAVPSATLSGSNCTIASGEASCAAPFTWAISNATSPNLFNSTTGIQYTTASSGTNVSFAITKGNNTVQARNGTTVLRSTPVTGTCASGTVWDGSVCAPTNPPTVSISASPRRVGVGGSSTISWSSNHVTSCTVTKNGAFFSSAHTSAGTLDTGITAQTEYKIDCEGNDGSTGNIATVLVNVNPGFTEF